ncbi:unnamed protein product [Triticum turgidum subsp. durum]|uniref:Rhodanese domain-containing protein n=1 Tax=Triticum turgidum subsp. durum TaxID=4567 RepID=A0A9R0XE87_TRITD|nr:unnamed protein product [Triticum turgidum subsp. durum]
MIAASSIVKANLPCSSRISSCSDFSSGHLWRPLEAAKHYRAHGVRSLRVTCAATKTAKSPAEEEWKIKRQFLLEKRVRSVDVKEALRLQNENNFVILDVRPEAEFKQAHPPGAVNVQIYRLIKEWTAWDIARRAAFAFFGIFAGTEENPEFIKSSSPALCYGLRLPWETVAQDTFNRLGRRSNDRLCVSLIAAYLLVLNGYKNVFHLDGGLYTWFKEDLPSEGEED